MTNGTAARNPRYVKNTGTNEQVMGDVDLISTFPSVNLTPFSEMFDDFELCFRDFLLKLKISFKRIH